MKLTYSVNIPSEYGAGLRGFTDEVSIDIASGDPGGEAGEFEEHMRQSLAEWFDGARVKLQKHKPNCPAMPDDPFGHPPVVGECTCTPPPTPKGVSGEGQQWMPIETAPKDEEALFWIVPKTVHETYYNTTGQPILAKGDPHLVKCRYGCWSSLWKATLWQPLPPPPSASNTAAGVEP